MWNTLHFFSTGFCCTNTHLFKKLSGICRNNRAIESFGNDYTFSSLANGSWTNKYNKRFIKHFLLADFADFCRFLIFFCVNPRYVSVIINFLLVAAAFFISAFKFFLIILSALICEICVQFFVLWC